jgi:hypothetical protein
MWQTDFSELETTAAALGSAPVVDDHAKLGLSSGIEAGDRGAR